MVCKDITKLVQRLEAFEDRLNVRIEAISAFETEPDGDAQTLITVRGELHSEEGASISQDINIQLSVYDSEGRVILTSEDYVNSESFFGFHTFELHCYVNAGSATKLRLYPKREA